MIKRINYLYIIPAVLFLVFGFANTAQAVCPVCVVAVGAGVGLSRWLGIDDTITGLWIGGLLVAISFWTIIWLKNKNWAFKTYQYLIPIAYYAAVLIPLYFKEIIGHPLNRFWGIDKLLLGIIIGSLFFLLGIQYSNHLKNKNHQKAFFKFQKVIIPIIPLIILSAVFYFITR